MKTLNIYLVCSMAIYLTACGWFDNVDPKPKEENLATYHWEGTLYKGYGEEVWANAQISLEGQHPQGLTYERLTIAQGVTNENGHFRLEYTIDSTDSKYDKYDNGLYEVRFQVGGGYPLMTSPWKVNVVRDIAQNDHQKVVVICNLSNGDSLYCALGQLVSASCQIGMKFPVIEKSYQVSACQIPDKTRTIKLISGATSKWNNEPREDFYLPYGITKRDFQLAFEALRIDSVPDDFNRIELEFRGFPFTDTVYLDL